MSVLLLPPVASEQRSIPPSRGVVSRRVGALLALGCALLGMSGCSIGPTKLTSDRPGYNAAIQQTEKEEMLLNIVRLRYGENIKFLQVTSIVSSLSGSVNTPGGVTFPFGAGAAQKKVADLGFSYSDSPTITYVPVEGQQFATQFLTSVPTSVLQALLQSGWYIDQVMELLIDRVGPLVNDPDAPSHSKFIKLLSTLRKIQDRGDLQFVWVPMTDQVLADKLPLSAVTTRIFSGPTLTNLRYNQNPDGTYQLLQALGDTVVMELHYANEEEANQVSDLLGPMSARPKGVLVEHMSLGSATAPTNLYAKEEPVTQLRLNMRSLADMMYSVIPGVEVPPEDAAVAMPGQPKAPKLISIRQSDSLPDKSFVATNYRGRWFSIPDSDIASKLNLQLMLSILSLQTVSGGAAPSLSLPLGH